MYYLWQEKWKWLILSMNEALSWLHESNLILSTNWIIFHDTHFAFWNISTLFFRNKNFKVVKEKFHCISPPLLPENNYWNCVNRKIYHKKVKEYISFKRKVCEISYTTKSNKIIKKQPPEVFCKKGVLSNFIEKRLQRKCFLVNIAKFLRTSILKNICERLLLIISSSSWKSISDKCLTYLLCFKRNIFKKGTLQNSQKKCAYYYLIMVLLWYRYNPNYSRIMAKIM